MRRTPINPVNKARRKKSHARNYGDLGDWVRGQTCAVGPCHKPSVPAHVKGKRAYGAWLTCPHTGELVGNICNLCNDHHNEQHQHGIQTFNKKYGLVMADVAREIGEQFKAQA